MIQSKLSAEYSEKEKQNKEQLLKRCDKQAREDARIAKAGRYSLLRNVAIFLCIIVMIISCIGFVQSLKETKQWSVPIAVLAILSFVGLIDTIMGKKMLIDKTINKLSNQYETEVYEKKKKELDTAARGSWGGVNPVTRKTENKKAEEIGGLLIFTPDNELVGVYAGDTEQSLDFVSKEIKKYADFVPNLFSQPFGYTQTQVMRRNYFS